MGGLLQDIRYSARALWRARGFALMVTLTLALGIGGNAAIFSVVNNVFLRPLPFAESERLVRLRDSMIDPAGQRASYNISDRNFLALKESNRVFSAVVAQAVENLTLTGGEIPERLSVVSVSEGSWEALGVRPVLGRVFTAEEERAGRDSRVALISHNLWQRRFGGAREALGQTLAFNEQSFTIVGVIPRGYNFPYDAEVWLPVTPNPAGRRAYAVFARLQPGVTLEQARAEMEVVSRQIAAQYPETMPGYGIEVTPLRESLIENQARIALALLGIVGFFLLLACANVANLMLARSLSRQKELAIRAALGASRWRQARQLLTESLMLAALGGAAGLLLTVWLGDYLATLVPSNLSQQLGLADVSIDLRLIGFIFVLVLLTGIASGLAPALKSSNPDLHSFMKDGGRSSTGGRNRRWLNAFVVSEIALALVLLAGAGLMAQNLWRLQQRDLGFATENLLTMQVTLPAERYGDGARRAAFVRQALEQVETAPGVEAAGITTANPIRGARWGAPVIIEGLEGSGEDATFRVNHRLISPGLLRAMGLPLLKGRDLTAQDDERAPGVALVSERMARRFWGAADPLGKRIRINRPDGQWLTVVGVVGDAQDAGDTRETWYLPYAQHAATPAAETLHLMVRGRIDAGALARAAQQAIWSVDRNLAVYRSATMEEVRAETLAQDRLGAVTVTLFALFGLILAALGIYGVMSFVVSQRTREIGIRIALGAQRSDVFRLVLRQGLTLALAGVGIGLAATFALARVMASLFADMGAPAPLIAVGLALLLTAVSLFASYVPARRATRVDPLVALHYE